MKELHNLTETEAQHIASLLGEPYIKHYVNDDNKWDSINLAVTIKTTSTMNENRDDSSISIYYDGKITLHRNNGDWSGHRQIEINTLSVIDYLREQGYTFKYK